MRILGGIGVATCAIAAAVFITTTPFSGPQNKIEVQTAGAERATAVIAGVTGAAAAPPAEGAGAVEERSDHDEGAAALALQQHLDQLPASGAADRDNPPSYAELRVIPQSELEPKSERYKELLARAEAGEEQAQVDLGKLIYECAGHRSASDGDYSHCSGVPEATHEALEEWWIGPAQNGDAEAQRLLADVYPYGSEQNIHWNRQAAQSGDVEAQVVLGRSLLESDNPNAGIEAMVAFSAAASAGDLTARALADQLSTQLTAYEYQQAMNRIEEQD